MNTVDLIELFGILREFGVAKYKDERLSIEFHIPLVHNSKEQVSNISDVEPAKPKPKIDENLQKVINALPPGYMQAFEIK
jgi:hypothetical protein